MNSIFGFFIPSEKIIVDLDCNHLEYCKNFVDNYADVEIKNRFKRFLEMFIKVACKDISVVSNPYIDFCIMVLGWYKIGDICTPKKITMCYSGAREYYGFPMNTYYYLKKNGYEFEIIKSYSWIEKIL